MIGSTALDRFFVECTLSGIDFENKETAEAAMKIADKYELSYDCGIEMLYIRAFENHKGMIRRMGMSF